MEGKLLAMTVLTVLPALSGKDNSKLTGDRMKILMLSVPFMISYLVAPDVSWNILTYSMI